MSRKKTHRRRKSTKASTISQGSESAMSKKGEHSGKRSTRWGKAVKIINKEVAGALEDEECSGKFPEDHKKTNARRRIGRKTRSSNWNFDDFSGIRAPAEGAPMVDLIKYGSALVSRLKDPNASPASKEPLPRKKSMKGGGQTKS